MIYIIVKINDKENNYNDIVITVSEKDIKELFPTDIKRIIPKDMLSYNIVFTADVNKEKLESNLVVHSKAYIVESTE